MIWLVVALKVAALAETEVVVLLLLVVDAMVVAVAGLLPTGLPDGGGGCVIWLFEEVEEFVWLPVRLRVVGFCGGIGRFGWGFGDATTVLG